MMEWASAFLKLWLTRVANQIMKGLGVIYQKAEHLGEAMAPNWRLGSQNARGSRHQFTRYEYLSYGFGKLLSARSLVQCRPPKKVDPVNMG